jgi:metallophosphoesterase superfamily enzyme
MELLAGGARLRLLPERAAYLPEHHTLLVADAHIGKAQSFRRLGVPVPGGTTGSHAARLSRAVAATGARQVVFLGDLLHAAHARATATLQALAAWRGAHSGPGPDAGARQPRRAMPAIHPPTGAVRCLDGPLPLGRLALAHHPDPVAGRYVLAGHTHPAAVVSGRGHGHLRLPCFHFGPAGGRAAGLWRRSPACTSCRSGADDRVYVVADNCVRPLNSLP